MEKIELFAELAAGRWEEHRRRMETVVQQLRQQMEDKRLQLLQLQEHPPLVRPVDAPPASLLGLSDNLLVEVVRHVEPAIVLSTMNRVCVTMRSFVALRYPGVLKILAATPAVVRVHLLRRLFDLERGGDPTLLRLIAEYAMRYPWLIDCTITTHTRYPLIWTDDLPTCDISLAEESFFFGLMNDGPEECDDPTPFAHLVHSTRKSELPLPTWDGPIPSYDIDELNLLEGLRGDELAVAKELDLSKLCLDWIAKLKPRQQTLFPFMNVGNCLLVNESGFNLDERCYIKDLEDRLGLPIGELVHLSRWRGGEGLPPGAQQEVKKMSDEQTPYANILGAATAADLRQAYLAVKTSKYDEHYELLADVSVELRPATDQMAPPAGLVDILEATGTNFMPPPSLGHLRGHPDCDGSSSVQLVIRLGFDHGS